MNVYRALFLAGVVSVQASSSSGSSLLPLNRLPEIGLDPIVVKNIFQNEKNVTLKWDEVLKVSADEEGKEISFDSLDGISIVVPADAALGSPNKGPEIGTL